MTDELNSSINFTNNDVEEIELKKLFNDKTEDILRELNLNVGTLDSSEFSVVDYINEMFPNEQSLASIDDIMEGIEYKIKDLEEETRKTLRGQWKSESNGHTAVQEATSMIQDLFQKIREVQAQATHSENMVKEITRDIQQLDLAKKNLTISITTLNNLTLLMSSVDRLKALLKLSTDEITNNEKASSGNPFEDHMGGNVSSSGVGSKNMNVYAEIDEHLAHSTKILNQLKQQFADIPVIKDLDADMNQIIKELGHGQLQTDIRNVLMSGKANSNNMELVDQLHSMCRCVDQIDPPNNRKALIKWYIDHQLSEYRVLFEETQSTAWLDKIDHRYSWLRSNLLNFDKKFSLYFPKSWMMIERLVLEFCEYTRSALVSLMRAQSSELTDSLVIFAIRRTQYFEDTLKKSFCADQLRSLIQEHQAAKEKDSQKNPFHEEMKSEPISDASNIVSGADGEEEEDDDVIDGIISSCFEAHLHLYIEDVNKVLNEQLKNHLINDYTVNESSINDKEFEKVLGDNNKDDLNKSGMNSSNVDSAENSLNSATNLFLMYRKVLNQAPLLSRGMPLVELSKVLARYLREYNTRVLLTQLPNSSSINNTVNTSNTNITSTTVSSINDSDNSTSNTTNTGINKESSNATSSSGVGISSTGDTNTIANETISAASVVAVQASSVALNTANQIFHSLLKDDQSTRLTKEELKKVCIILVTASYCLNTVEELERRLKSKVRPRKKLAPLIDLSGEVEQFRITRAHCVQVLATELEIGSCEPALTQMVRTNWANITAVGDQSRYVGLIGNRLNDMINIIRPPLCGVRAFFTQICIQFAHGFTARFLTSMFRCRLPSTIAAEQLLLDTHSIKTVLLRLPVLGLKVHPDPPRSFTNVVLQGMGRAEKVVKCALTPISAGSGGASFVEAALHLLPDTDATELQRVLDMRCVRRPDQAAILDEFRRRQKTQVSSSQHNENASGPNSRTTLSGAGVDGKQQSSLSRSHEAKKMSQLERLMNIIK